MDKKMKTFLLTGVFAGTVEPIRIPKQFARPKKNHDRFIWESQDGTKTNIKDLDDNHLRNIYNLLARTICWAKELYEKCNYSEYERLFAESSHYTLVYCMNALMYIGHEMYLRFHNSVYDDEHLSIVLAEIGGWANDPR
jgi:hypothetical protein